MDPPTAQNDGRSKKGRKGQANGNADGMNGHITRSSRQTQQQQKRKQGWIASLISITARLLLWYTAIAAIFWCPSSVSDLTESHPRVCKHYLTVREHATPYLQPYYDLYLAPHVDKARPYVDGMNQHVYTPAATFTKHNYGIYGAPRVEQLKVTARKEWEKTVRPRLEQAQANAKAQYDAQLGPHVQKGVDAVHPHYEKARASLEEKYETTLIPAYNFVLPYAKQGYAHGHHLTVNYVFPFVQYAEASTRHFLVRTAWPRLRILYGDNVEPQLMRISERLGRYKDSKKLEEAVEEVDSPSSASSIVSEAQATASASSTVASSSDSTESASTSSSSKKEKETDPIGAARGKINSDLRTWQEKFATAADKGSDDLETRVEEIAKSQIATADGVGGALLVELEEAASSAQANVKSAIQRLVKELPEDVTDEDRESAYEAVAEAVKKELLVLREKSVAVRDWKSQHWEELHNLIKAAADSTMDVIDNIRDLGLQEIGMRWAWMDGVTYKDWQKYHQLKRTWDEWRQEVQARGFQHVDHAKARRFAQEFEDKAMIVAKGTVPELTRLKDVARWKIWAQDDTDDFSDKAVPPKVAKAAGDAAQEIVGKVQQASSAVAGSSQGPVESWFSEGSKTVSSISTKATDDLGIISLDKPTEGVESGASKVASSISSGSESVISAAEHKVDQATEAIKGTPAPPSESVASDASSSVESAATEASSSVESAATEASKAAESPKKVMGGAMAQFVEAKEVVYDDIVSDDDMSYSEKVQSIVSEAGDKAADITRAVSEALLEPTSTQGQMASTAA